MKTLILTVIAVLAMTTATFANKPEKVTLRHGQQKTAARGDLKIKFISVVEDSRCPVGANCVWAGNAQIQVKITDRQGRSKISVINSTTGPLGDQFGGYAINLTSLTPVPTVDGKPTLSRYTATFSIARLYR